MSDRTIVEKSIRIEAQPSKVWETITNPDLIKKWLSDKEYTIISDWQIGGSIVFKDHSIKSSKEDHGIILDLIPDKLFRYSYWSWVSRLPDLPENYTIIEFKLTPDKDQTILSVTQSNLIA